MSISTQVPTEKLEIADWPLHITTADKCCESAYAFYMYIVSRGLAGATSVCTIFIASCRLTSVFSRDVGSSEINLRP